MAITDGFATTAALQANIFVQADVGALVPDLQAGLIYRVARPGPGSFACTLFGSQLGPVRPTPAEVALVANAASLDLSANQRFQLTAIITADFALTLANGQDGDIGSFDFKQAAAGGKKITGITVAGRTARMRDTLTTVNSTAALVANAHNRLSWEFATEGGNAVVIFNMTSTIAASFA